MSNKKKYKSLFGAKGLITASQYLAERIILKRIHKKGLSLPDRFWASGDIQYKYWKNILISEKIKADKLLKKYDESCVIKALESHECKVILSLQNKKIYRVASELQKVKDTKEKVKEKVNIESVPVSSLPRKKTGKKSIIGRLND